MSQYKGRTLLLEMWDADETTPAYKPLGGIKTKDFTRDNPVADTTGQQTTDGETEAAYTGYSTVSLSGNGVVDSTEDTTIASYKQLTAIANSTDPKVKFRLSDAIETYEGEFLITSFGKSAEQTDMIQFTISLQNAGTVTHTVL